MASRGFDTTMNIAWGDLATALRVTSFTIPAFTLRGSARLIPALRDARAGPHKAERLPLRHPPDDVGEHDVAEVPLGQPLRGRRPDVSRSDDRDLFPAHRIPPLDGIKLLKGTI